VSNGAKQSVRVAVGGEEFSLRTELPAEYAREIAAYLDESLRKIRTVMPTLELHKAAILAGLAVTDELFRARRADDDLAHRIESLTEEITRLLPPAKRGSRAAQPD
jgi:cell division protein ZapA (FtsZ GTPase activity inhibitor)